MILDDKKNYVKTADVTNGDMITFKSEGVWQENRRFTYDDGNPKVDFIIKVELNGEEKDMRLNKTNRDIVIKAYGKETKDWIDKTAKITKVQAMIAGKMMDMIILEIDGIQKNTFIL